MAKALLAGPASDSAGMQKRITTGSSSQAQKSSDAQAKKSGKDQWRVNPLSSASAWSPQKKGQRPFGAAGASSPQQRVPNPRLLLREALVEHALLRKDGTMVIGPMWARPFLREQEELLGDFRLPAGLRRRNSAGSASAASPAQYGGAMVPFNGGNGVGFGGRRRAPRFKSIFGAKQLAGGAPVPQARLKSGPKADAARHVHGSNSSIGGSSASSQQSSLNVSKRGVIVPQVFTVPLLRGIAAARRPVGGAAMMASKRSIQGLDDFSASNIFGSRGRSHSMSRRTRRSVGDSQRSVGAAEQVEQIALAAAAAAARREANALESG